MIPIANGFDLAVLRCLSEIGGGGVAAVAREFDRSRSYVRAGLVTLAETEYLHASSPAPRFHTYELTAEGAAVARRVTELADA